jgi:nitroreductase
VELEEVLRRRRMVRDFDPDRPVPATLRERLLDDARRGPSAGFSQGFAFLVCESVGERDRFWVAATPVGGGQTAWLAGMRRAPLVVVVCCCEQAYRDRYAEPDKSAAGPGLDRWPVPYWHVDAGMATLLLLLSVTDAGLGACFFGVPGERVGPLREAFGVPAEQSPTGAVAVGYPAAGEQPSGSPTRHRRRAKDEQVHRGRW